MKTSKTPSPESFFKIPRILSAAAFAAAFLFFAPAFAQDIENIYFNGISSSVESAYLNEPSNWYADPDRTQPFEGSLDGANYGKYDAYVSFSKGQLPILTSLRDGSVTDLRNLNYSVSGINGRNDILTFGGSKILRTYGDWNLSLKLDPAAANESVVSVGMWEYAKADIRGDWNINVDKNGASGWFGLRIYDRDSNRPASFLVHGNVVVSSGNDRELILYTENNSFLVEGAVDLNGNCWGIAANNTGLSRSIGGLGDADGNGKGHGKLYMLNTSADSEATINFTNSEACDFSGAFQAKADNGDKALLNLAMMASDSRNGRQILRFSKMGTSWPNRTSVTDADINNVEVNSGRLDIGMYDGMKGDNLGIYGYSGNAADAVFSAAGLSSGLEIGKVQFDTMTFYEGTIIFDLGEVENDFIQINGGVTKSSAGSQITFDMNITKDDLQMYLEALGAETMEWDLMSFKTDDSDFALTDIILKTQAGIDGELSFLADDSSGLTTVQLSLGVIPEPAAIAAIIGAIALSLAAWRRRR